MASTYEPIATTTLGSAASSITFSSIPSTYTDLRLVIVGTGSVANNPLVTFNGNSSAVYSNTRLTGNGTAASSAALTSMNFFNIMQQGFSTTIPHMMTIDIFSYAGSTYKTALFTEASDNNGSGSTTIQVGLFSSTTAISSVTFTANTGNFATGTTATIWGIKAA